MTPTIRKTAAMQASCAIAVGILLDQLGALLAADALKNKGVEQAFKVIKYAD